MGTWSLPVVKRAGRGVDHPPPSSPEVKERVQLYLYFPSGPSSALEKTLPFTSSEVVCDAEPQYQSMKLYKEVSSIATVDKYVAAFDAARRPSLKAHRSDNLTYHRSLLI